MIYVSLFFGAILWAIGVAALRRPGWWTAAFVILGLLSLMGLPFPPVALLFLTMSVVLFLRPLLIHRPRMAAALALAAFIAPYGLVSFFAGVELRRVAELRDKHPYQSIEDRLPKHAPLVPSQKLSEDAVQRLDTLEVELFAGNTRSYTLEVLHERQTRAFVDSPGFGSVRMMRPREEYIRSRVHGEPIPQPVPIRASAEKLDDEPWKPQRSGSDMHDMHRDGVVDFVHTEGYGYVKDRRHVAGFLPHSFTEVPRDRGNWSIGAVELVGLLLYPEPVAYVSENLPRMEELRKAPTRKLDEIEKAGHAAIVRGDDLFTAETGTGRRMLGSIRATKQCLACHDGERGTLLGAFSYWLLEDKQKVNGTQNGK